MAEYAGSSKLVFMVRMCLSSVFGVRDELDERCGDDDSCTEVTCEEVDVDVYFQPFHSFRHDGEESSCRADDEDNEERRDTGAESAIIFVFSAVEIADYCCWIGGIEIHIVEVDV